MNGRILGPLLALALLTACGGSGPVQAARTVSVNGSTSLEKVILTLAEGYMADHPEVKISYDPAGSSAGIQAADSGACDIGLSSRRLTEAEAQGLTETISSLDGIAVVVHASNPLESLTLADLAGLYTGKTADWSQLGGVPGPVACIGREAGSGTRDGFEQAVGIQGRCRLAQELTATGAVLEAVGRNPQAIGYASLASAQGREDVRLLAVEGVPCTEDSVRDGTYPIQRPFVFVTKGPLSGDALSFFQWALSPAAAPLIRAAGAVPP